MPKASTLTSNASYEPEALQMLGEAFDEVWASVASDFGADPTVIEAGRIRLATIVLELAKDGQLGPLQITRTAARLIREDARNGSIAPLEQGADETTPLSDNNPPSQGGVLDPEALNMLRLCFDDTWREIAGNFAHDQADAARSKLANLILRLAGDGELSRHELGQAAMRLMREQARP